MDLVQTQPTVGSGFRRELGRDEIGLFCPIPAYGASEMKTPRRFQVLRVFAAYPQQLRKGAEVVP